MKKPHVIPAEAGIQSGPRGRGGDTACRLGSINFINSLPVDYGLISGAVSAPCAITRAEPSALNRMMIRGELDMGSVSALHYVEHAADFLVLPDLSISSRSGVKSVLFFASDRAENLAGMRIAVTTKGKTTPALLAILFRNRWKTAPIFVPADEGIETFASKGYAGTLLIGDESLAAADRAQGLTVYDLAEEWKALTGHAFVFAVWVVNRRFFGSDPALAERVYAAILASRKWGFDNPGLIVSAAAQRVHLMRPVLESYFRELRYDFGPDLVTSLRLYAELAVEAGLAWKPLTFEMMEIAGAKA